jgi:hypothetical protein
MYPAKIRHGQVKQVYLLAKAAKRPRTQVIREVVDRTWHEKVEQTLKNEHADDPYCEGSGGAFHQRADGLEPVSLVDAHL